MQRFVGTRQLVLLESTSKKSNSDLSGRCDGFIRVVVPATEPVPCAIIGDISSSNNNNNSNSSINDTENNNNNNTCEKVMLQIGDYVEVEITEASKVSLKCIPIQRTTLQQFYSNRNTPNTFNSQTQKQQKQQKQKENSNDNDNDKYKYYDLKYNDNNQQVAYA